MTEDEAVRESLSVAIEQLRQAANLLRGGERDEVWKAANLLLEASNTLVTVRWMMGRKVEA